MKTALTDNPAALYWASFNRFEMRLPAQAVTDIHQSGDNMPAVAHWAPLVREQVSRDGFRNCPTPEKIRAELAEYGAWDSFELEDDAANWLRIVWCAAHNIAEDDAPDCSEPLKN